MSMLSEILIKVAEVVTDELLKKLRETLETASDSEVRQALNNSRVGSAAKGLIKSEAMKRGLI